MSSGRTREKVRDFDFVVVGGGLAGLCTAVAAARHGANTALVQDRPVLGGNSSSEIRVGPLGSASFNAWSRETGILDELLMEERGRNHDGVYEYQPKAHVLHRVLDGDIRNKLRSVARHQPSVGSAPEIPKSLENSDLKKARKGRIQKPRKASAAVMIGRMMIQSDPAICVVPGSM